MINPLSSDEIVSFKNNQCFCGFFWIRSSGAPYFKWFSNDFFEMKWNQEDLYFSGFLSALNSSGEVFFDGDILRYVEFQDYKIYLSKLKTNDTFALITIKECPDLLATTLLQRMTEHYYTSKLTIDDPVGPAPAEVEEVFLSYLDNIVENNYQKDSKYQFHRVKRKNECENDSNSERKRLIKELKSRIFELEVKLGSNSSVDRDIGHELNNVLSTILGNITLSLMDTENGSMQRENLQDAENACLRAKNLTNRLLNLSKNIGKNNESFNNEIVQEHQLKIDTTIQNTEIILGTGRILILDDDLKILQVSEKMLTRLGYDVEVATSLDQAIGLYRREMNKGRKFDAVILDLSELGGLGGFGALIWLKLDPNINAIVSSGYANDPVFDQYKRHGFCGGLKKPYDIAELSQLLDKIIKKAK